MAEAQEAIERLAAAPAEEGLVIRDIWLLRLRALLAGAHRDAPTYAHLRDRTATWRERLASKDISRGPMRCRDGGHPGRAAHVVLKQTSFESLKTLCRNHRERRRPGVSGRLRPLRCRSTKRRYDAFKARPKGSETPNLLIRRQPCAVAQEADGAKR